MRIILYSGKGGVGKTSLSAATAVRCAEIGHRTIVLSTDSAHSLSDSLGKEIGPEKTQIAPNLFAQEINVQRELRANWGQIKSFIVDLLNKQGMDNLVAEEFSVLPGMEELFSLLRLKEYYDQNEFDLAIIDCAPTAATIRMLGFPDIIRWYMERFFHVERRVVKVIKPVVERIYDNVVLPTDEVYFSMEELYQKIDSLKNVLSDPKQTTVRLVFNPEKMVIKESQRAFTYLNLFGHSVDAVIANRLLPDTVNDPYFKKWKKIQQKYLNLAKDIFHPLPILKAKLFEEEMLGQEQLLEFARQVFGDKDPADIFHEERPYRIERDKDRYHLLIKIPFVDKSDIDMWVAGDELILQWGNFRSNTILPTNLLDRKLEEAKYIDEHLRVTFGKYNGSGSG
jgi:arsenite-transporting ATPase